METNLFTLTFVTIAEEYLSFTVSCNDVKVLMRFFKEGEIFSFKTQNELSKIILKNSFQLKKILRSAIKGKPQPGEIVYFNFITDFPFVEEKDFNHYILLDRRFPKIDISVVKNEPFLSYKLYTDGSYAQNFEQSGYAGVIEDLTGNQEVFYAFSKSKSSNKTELLAVIDGLNRLKNVSKIQICTDSRFVIRGLLQWIHFWKLNNWHTAQGKIVKFKEYWQQLDELSLGKQIVLKWIKGHSGNLNQDLCHQLAKQIATKKHLM